MTIPVYPDTPKPFKAFSNSQAFKTLVSDFDYGNEVRIMLIRFAKRSFELQYRVTLADRNTLHSFFRTAMGKLNPFWFVDPQKRMWTDEFVGYGTNAALTLDLHSKNTVNDATLVIYEDGVAQVKDTDFTFVSGGGDASSDRITWISGHYPTAGALITSNFTGNLRIKGRFDDDSFQEDLSNPGLFFITNHIVEIQW